MLSDQHRTSATPRNLSVSLLALALHRANCLVIVLASFSITHLDTQSPDRGDQVTLN